MPTSDPRQQAIDFAAADRLAGERLVQLGRALRDVAADAAECAFARLVYDQGQSGMRPWSPAGGDEVVLGHAWGPRCGRSKLYRARSRLASLRVVTADAVTDEAGRRVGTAYRIDWAGVYSIRGLALPDYLRPTTGPAVAPSAGTTTGPAVAPSAGTTTGHGRAVANVPGESTAWTGESTAWTGESTAWTGESTAWTDAGPRTISARARLSLSLSLSCLVGDVKTKTRERWEEVRTLARETADRLLPPHTRRRLVIDEETGQHTWRPVPLDRRTRVFFLAAAAMAVALDDGDWRGWLADAVETTVRATPANPPAFLRGVLRNGLAEYLGLCESGETHALLGRLLAAVRPTINAMCREPP